MANSKPRHASVANNAAKTNRIMVDVFMARADAQQLFGRDFAVNLCIHTGGIGVGLWLVNRGMLTFLEYPDHN